MSTRYRSLLVVASLLSAASLSACYTLLKHPRLAELDYGRPDSRQCGNCHSSEEIWSFNHASKGSTSAGDKNKWAKYYDLPWWYERQWDYDPQGKDRTAQSADDEKGKNEKNAAE